jgi:hypothetical protein
MKPVIINYNTVLLIQTIFIILFMFPDLSLLLWKNLAKKWTLSLGNSILKRNLAAEKKVKKYWEIDLRKFK